MAILLIPDMSRFKESSEHVRFNLHGALIFLKIVKGLSRGPIGKVPHCAGLHFICFFYSVLCVVYLLF